MVVTLGIVLMIAGVAWRGVSIENIERIWNSLLARPSGPMAFRFILQPLMAAIVAIRDGLYDVRGNRSPFLWTILSNPKERVGRLHEGLNATARIILLGLTMDTVGSPLIGTGKAGRKEGQTYAVTAGPGLHNGCCRWSGSRRILVSACARYRSWCRWRCHAVKVDDFKPKAGDGFRRRGSRVGQLGTEGGRIRACGDVAVVELCAQRFVGPGDVEGYLIRIWSHGLRLAVGG